VSQGLGTVERTTESANEGKQEGTKKMKVTKNADHNSIEIDFEGVKPDEKVRNLMKAYGFWWFGKNKVWCHTLEIDGEFFEKFVEERIRPLVTPAVSKEQIAAAIQEMSAEDQQAILAKIMGK
jgi:hypothetical protein